jgi:DMSO/TMAO reductase YedYZ molybdopterin-dependent catalytic subunit
MINFNQSQKIVGIFFIISILVMSTFTVYWFSTNPKPLPYNEIRNYEGQDLSSINDFRENSIRGTQYINKTNYRLNITGLVDTLKVYQYDQVLDHQKYTKIVTLDCVEGWSVKILWEGILLKDLFSEVGIKPEAKVVILRAVDGYSTSFPIEYFSDKNILLAYKMNGVEIPPERGFPFQLVAESQYGYKWIKWITQIEISDNLDYRGYWESRGYPNDAPLP